MKIANEKIVSIHYHLTNPEGEVLDSSKGADPLIFLFGVGELIPGLEKELEGKVKGDTLQAIIPSEDAYGPREDQMVQEIPKSQFETDEEINIGMQYEVETDVGGILVTVTEIKDDSIIVDGNHPLAGMTLHFDVSIEDVRDATKEELEHEHAHGEDGTESH